MKVIIIVCTINIINESTSNNGMFRPIDVPLLAEKSRINGILQTSALVTEFMIFMMFQSFFP